MNLLILTQILDLDDSNLGFFHEWVLKLSQKCDHVYIICLKKGKYCLPKNVSVFSLGKEHGVSKVVYIYRFYKYIFKLIYRYDNVFVHMSQIYVIMGGVFWRLFGKKIGLWYAHGRVSRSLKIASFFVNYIFTSSSSGCRLKSGKIKTVGQGIDVDFFKNIPGARQRVSKGVRLLSIGRLSVVKNHMKLIKAVEILKYKNVPVELNIVGSPITASDMDYRDKITKYIFERSLQDLVHMHDGVRQSELIDYFRGSDMLVNLSDTGSLDKAVLEAMSFGLLVITSNQAFSGSPVYLDRLGLFLEKNDPSLVAEKISQFSFIDQKNRESLVATLREIVVGGHSLDNLVKNTLGFYN